MYIYIIHVSHLNALLIEQVSGGSEARSRISFTGIDLIAVTLRARLCLLCSLE